MESLRAWKEEAFETRRREKKRMIRVRNEAVGYGYYRFFNYPLFFRAPLFKFSSSATIVPSQPKPAPLRHKRTRDTDEWRLVYLGILLDPLLRRIPLDIFVVPEYQLRVFHSVGTHCFALVSQYCRRFNENFLFLFFF